MTMPRKPDLLEAGVPTRVKFGYDGERKAYFYDVRASNGDKFRMDALNLDTARTIARREPNFFVMEGIFGGKRRRIAFFGDSHDFQLARGTASWKRIMDRMGISGKEFPIAALEQRLQPIYLKRFEKRGMKATTADLPDPTKYDARDYLKAIGANKHYSSAYTDNPLVRKLFANVPKTRIEKEVLQIRRNASQALRIGRLLREGNVFSTQGGGHTPDLVDLYRGLGFKIIRKARISPKYGLSMSELKSAAKIRRWFIARGGELGQLLSKPR